MFINELVVKSDKELYEEFLNGNEEAFNFIVKKYRMQVISFVMKYVRNFEIAEDLAQDTFVYMLINKKEYDFKYTLKTYLFTIAKCRAINYIKKNKKIVPLDETSISIEDNIDEILIRQEKKKMLLKKIKQLKPEYKIVIYLKDIKEFNNNEICKILNKTISQVKMLHYRARKSLSKELKKGNDIDEK